uniref:Uncharacterized protein n=1 Tax=Ascaris lumbricoides TaxID=6252 RepID=A0A0M3HYR8_ASCLU
MSIPRSPVNGNTPSHPGICFFTTGNPDQGSSPCQISHSVVKTVWYTGNHGKITSAVAKLDLDIFNQTKCWEEDAVTHWQDRRMTCRFWNTGAG